MKMYMPFKEVNIESSAKRTDTTQIDPSRHDRKIVD